MFRGLTMAMMPQSELSNQALEILRQFVNSDSRCFYSVEGLGGVHILSLENGGSISFEDRKFLKDDLRQLVSLGLLSLDHTSDGSTEIYGVTRNAARFIDAVDQRPISASIAEFVGQS
jgi:hypothetical protein